MRRVTTVTSPAPRALVRDAREREEQVGQPIEIDDDERRNLRLASELDDAALGAAADGARDVQRGGLWRAAGNDERSERLELGVAVVDRALELGDARVVDARLLEMLAHLLAIGRGEQRADGEQVALDRDEHLVDARHRLGGANEAEHGVQLIDVAVGLDARMALGNAAAAEQARVAGSPVFV